MYGRRRPAAAHVGQRVGGRAGIVAAADGLGEQAAGCVVASGGEGDCTACGDKRLDGGTACIGVGSVDKYILMRIRHDEAPGPGAGGARRGLGAGAAAVVFHAFLEIVIGHGAYGIRLLSGRV